MASKKSSFSNACKYESVSVKCVWETLDGHNHHQSTSYFPLKHG